MLVNLPQIIALDFDGVICDGLPEYLATTKKTYLQVWQTEQIDKLDELASSFYRLRPVIETGWEMPILLRALLLGFTEEEILANWSLIAKKIVASENLDSKEIGKKLDLTRDNWINNDLNSWLSLHRFYPGVLSTLKQIINLSVDLYIVTTKEGRFVNQLLQQQGIKLSEKQIIGKESQLPKYQTLKSLLQTSTSPENTTIWFVEDRLKTLQLVRQQPDLLKVKLFLADWGYNTELERATADKDKDIEVLSLEQFQQKFAS